MDTAGVHQMKALPQGRSRTPGRPGGLRVFFRTAGTGLLASFLMLGVARLLRSASFLIVGLAALSYTVLLCGMLTSQHQRLAVTSVLRHSVATVRQPNMLTCTASGYRVAQPLLLSVEPLLPPYVVQRHSTHADDGTTVFFDATRKGQYAMGAARVSLQDPLRIFSIHSLIPSGLVLTVVPRPLSLAAMHIALTSPIDGQRVRYAPNVDTSQLTGTHPYDGEPMNRIHWKMSAHTGTLVVKDFTPSASQTVVLLVNYTVHRDTGFTLDVLDETLSTAAASILHYVHDRNLPFGLAAIGSRAYWTGTGHDRMHLLSCLTAVARSQAAQTEDTANVLDWLNQNARAIPPQSQLVLLAHEMDETEVVHLLRQREHFARITIVLFPEGTFLMPGEHRAPYYLKDTSKLLRMRSLQHVLRENGIELTIVGLNDPIAALATG
ncbi:MAG TPA: DUF58 domain-containing protein [Clostridia bacterium]|nr:DUF58 domain-containing protein [Clostridia bacterium]